MPYMSRAGLVSLVLFFLSIGFAVAAPLTERISSSLATHYDSYDSGFVARSLRDRALDIADPEYEIREYLSLFDEREFDSDFNEFTKRDYDFSVLDDRDFDDLEYITRDDSDLHVLYRRKSIFTKIKEGFQKLGHKIKAGFQKLGHKIKSGFQKFGQKVKSGFQKFGAKVKTGFKKFAQKAKAGFQKAGRVLKKGFQKVGKFIKKVAGKVAKVALKVVAAVASVAAKVVKFIPGVGQPLSMAIKGAAIGANIASDKIHANIGKLSKFTKGLDYVINPISSAAKAAGKGIANKGGKAGNIISQLMF